MSEKSPVSMERRVCLICGIDYDTGAILVDTRLRQSLERYTTTGLGLCAAHQKLCDQGLIALIECDPGKSGASSLTVFLEPHQAWRTGRVAFMTRAMCALAFDVEIAPNVPCVFVEPGVIDQLQARVKQ